MAALMTCGVRSTPPLAATRPVSVQVSELWVKIAAAGIAPDHWNPVSTRVIPSCERPRPVGSRASVSDLGTSCSPAWRHAPALRLKAHTAALLASLLTPPLSARLPSLESATRRPCASGVCGPPAPTSLGPCCVQTPFWRVKIHTAPVGGSNGAPETTVLPSAEMATDAPCVGNVPLDPVPTIRAISVQTPLDRVKIYSAPVVAGDGLESAPGPPSAAVFPSAERATEKPIVEDVEEISLACCLHT